MAENRNIVVNASSVRAVLDNHKSVSEQKVKEAVDDPVEQAMLVAGINNALIEIADNEDNPDVLSSPPSAIASQLQSFLAERAIIEDKPVARQLPGGAEQAKFDSNDWLGWAKSFFSWASGITPAKWLTAPPDPLAMTDDARVALFADWGTGLYGAPACAKCISGSSKPFTHVIHLGDVYYSGTEKEIDERLIGFWPNVAGARSFACNGNHEMYSGGHGYFEKALPQLGQKASYFACENEHWLLVGLDTAYEEHSLTRESRLAGQPAAGAGAEDEEARAPVTSPAVLAARQSGTQGHQLSEAAAQFAPHSRLVLGTRASLCYLRPSPGLESGRPMHRTWRFSLLPRHAGASETKRPAAGRRQRVAMVSRGRR